MCLLSGRRQAPVPGPRKGGQDGPKDRGQASQACRERGNAADEASTAGTTRRRSVSFF